MTVKKKAPRTGKGKREAAKDLSARKAAAVKGGATAKGQHIIKLAY
jgi:hypothetical protein